MAAACRGCHEISGGLDGALVSVHRLCLRLDARLVGEGSAVNRRPVTSSNIASIGWEQDSQGKGTMEVEFKSGHVYTYHEVPESVYESALGASSVGKFIASSVVDHFEHTRIK
jgi:hypothetical protein